MAPSRRVDLVALTCENRRSPEGASTPTGPLDPPSAAKPGRGPSVMMLDRSADGNTAPDGHDWGYVVAHATDPYWSKLTGNCGGCGNLGCHDGPCPGNSAGYCTVCPTRRATGEVR